MRKKFLILVINPGSTSTKVALFENEKLLFQQTLRHTKIELADYKHIWDQYNFRKNIILQFLSEKGVLLQSLSAVVARGGLFKPIQGGTYRVSETMIEDGRKSIQGEHASNLGAILAYGIGWEIGAPSFIVDPPCVDEFESLARYSGMPEIPRKSLVHALNIHAIARKAAHDLKIKYSESRFVVAHLGGGISVVPVRGGRIIDANNATSGGPFTPERTGTLPVMDFIELCFSKKYTKEEIKEKVMGKGGLVAYLGLNSAAEVERKIKEGDKQAKEVYEAMAYDISKEIGAMATVLECKLDTIVLTGGLVFSKMLVNWIRKRVEKIARVLLYPGEDELRALAQGALRVLKGEEEAKEY